MSLVNEDLSYVKFFEDPMQPRFACSSGLWTLYGPYYSLTFFDCFTITITNKHGSIRLTILLYFIQKVILYEKLSL